MIVIFIREAAKSYFFSGEPPRGVGAKAGPVRKKKLFSCSKKNPTKMLPLSSE